MHAEVRYSNEKRENHDNNELREAEIGCPEDYRLVDQTAV
jgi:hypothetical protein